MGSDASNPPPSTKLISPGHALVTWAEDSLPATEERLSLASLRSSLDLATESLRLTVLRYQAGEAVALEVVDAQNTVTQARNSLDDGLVRAQIALATVKSLTGSL